jgi:MFS family permease
MAITAAAGHERHGTFAALRSINFRIYFGGQLVSLSGTWMQNIAQGFLVFSMTRSEAMLGLVALAMGLPSVLLAPISGVIIERFPRRKLLLAVVTLQMLLAVIMTFLTATGLVEVWHIVLLAFLLGCVNAFDAPTRLSFVVEMVGKEDLQSGIALNSVMNSATRVVGPTLAGILLVQFGVVMCFLLNALSFVAVIISLVVMKVPHARAPERSTRPLAMLREGFGYVRHDRDVAPLLLLASIGGLLIVPLIQILPAFADVVLNSPKEGYAALSAAQGLGSVISGLTVGTVVALIGRGRVIVLGAALASVTMIGMASQTLVFPAAVFCALTGVAMVTYFVNINTQIQLTVPDAFRGRVSSLYTLSFIGMTPFGSLLLGVLAESFGTPTALSIYGVAIALLAGVVLLRYPHVVRLGAVTPRVAEAAAD